MLREGRAVNSAECTNRGARPAALENSGSAGTRQLRRYTGPG
jgi:hypothetical protein